MSASSKYLIAHLAINNETYLSKSIPFNKLHIQYSIAFTRALKLMCNTLLVDYAKR